MEPVVSVITAHHNRLEYLMQCIDSVKRLNRGYPYEHIIVDNGSSDGTVEWINYIKGLSHNPNYGDWWQLGQTLRYIRVEKKFGSLWPAVGLGIEAARGRYVMSLDNDYLLCRDQQLSKMVDIYVRLATQDPKLSTLAMRRFPVRGQMKLRDSFQLTFPWGVVTVGKVSLVTAIFVDREQMPDIGKADPTAPHLQAYEVRELEQRLIDGGTHSLHPDPEFPLRKQYGFGDQAHKYFGYRK